MTLIELADLLGIKHYNECEDYIVLEGINGGSKLIYARLKESETYKAFAKHLHQMGRDSLKMELNDLLSITKHN